MIFHKISTESGLIQIGDHITSSSLPGVGMKAIKDGYTVGIALESFDGENSTTTATIEVSPPAGGETSTTKTIKTGKILVFVNLGYSKLDVKYGEVEPPDGGSTSSYFSIDKTTGKVTAAFSGGLNLKGNSLENVSKILSANGSWSIDESGKLVVQELEVEGTAKFKGLTEFQNLTKFGTPENPQGITIYDKITREPLCVSSENKVLILQEGACGE